MSWSNTSIDFAVVLLAVFFIALYTWRTSWWRNAAGRAVVFLAGSVALIPTPKVIWTLSGYDVHGMAYIWTELICKLPVIFALIWIIITFERVRRKGLWHKHVEELDSAFHARRL